MSVQNYDRLINQSQGNDIINALLGITQAIAGNYPLQEKEASVTNFDPVTVLPDSGYYGMNRVSVNLDPLIVNLPNLVNLQQKSVTLSTAAQTILPDSGYLGLSEVSVPGMNLNALTVSANGIYNAAQDGYDGYSEVNVQVEPNVGEKVITVSGVYNASDDNLDGYNSVNVQVAGGAINVVANGTSFIGQFNAPVNILSGTAMNYMFSSFTRFNQPLTIPSTVQQLVSTFNSCTSFNQPVVIPEVAVNCMNMFSNCGVFNQFMYIPASVTNASLMFNNCMRFDSPVIFNKSATMYAYANVVSMFSMCRNLNSPVIFHEKALNSCISMFMNCNKFNQPVLVPASVNNCQGMFKFANNMRSDIILNGTFQGTSVATKGMITAVTGKPSLNIYCSNLSAINGTSTTYSITGAAITWEAVTNGYYNATYNIYLLNNVQDGLDKYNNYMNDYWNNYYNDSK